MVVKIGTYDFEFDNELAKKYEDLMMSNLQSASLSYVESSTGCSDMVAVCKNHTKNQIYAIIANGIKTELSLFGEVVNV